jgi:hypothetical protein
VCIKDFVSKWFWRMPVEQLTKTNIGDLLAYGFLYKSREQLEAEFAMKREQLELRAREADLAAARRQQDGDKELFAARQQLLDTMQRLQLQEDELRRDFT